jgi:uncharacterized protein with GYD domain
MASFLMFGKYSREAIKEISAERTKKVVSLIEEIGGEVNGMYVLLGEYDLMFIVDFPKTEEAIKASVALTKLTGISFSTYPAISVEKFDKMIAEK